MIKETENAIFKVTGKSLPDYVNEKRKRDDFYLRMIFAYHCKNSGINPENYLKRDRTTIVYYLKKYPDEMKYNKAFRQLAECVNEKLAEL